jgi:hypothetical protein
MDQPPNQSLAIEQDYQSYLEGLLTSDRHQCRAIFERWLESNVELRTPEKGKKISSTLAPSAIIRI